MDTYPPLTRTRITAVFCAMLGVAICAALFATFVPNMLQLGEGGWLFRWVAYAGAAFGFVMAFVMRAIFLKHLPPGERKTGTIQRQ